MNPTPHTEEVGILLSALDYWRTDGTDEEAQESDAASAAEMVQRCIESLRELGVDVAAEEA